MCLLFCCQIAESIRKPFALERRIHARNDMEEDASFAKLRDNIAGAVDAAVVATVSGNPLDARACRDESIGRSYRNQIIALLHCILRETGVEWMTPDDIPGAHPRRERTANKAAEVERAGAVQQLRVCGNVALFVREDQ